VQEFIQVLEITGHLLDRWGDDADPLGVLPLPPIPPETGGKGSPRSVRFKAAGLLSRRWPRTEDRIRSLKDTGLANLPLHDFAQNEIRCAVVALAADLVAWLQTLALAGHEARRWEPKRLRLRLLSIPACHARTGRRQLLHLATTAPFTALALQALAALAQLTVRSAPRPAPG
jgi:hypothetical protein